MYIAIDPGKNVGVATFKEDGSDIYKKVMDLDTEFRFFLDKVYKFHSESDEPVNFIMEDFKLVFGKALEQTGSDMPASRCIGAVEQVSSMLAGKSKVLLNPPGNLRTALKWAGYPTLANKPRSWHCPDDISAHAHGVFKLIQLDVRKHPIFS